MQIDKQALIELKQIHFEETGQVLTDEQVFDMGNKLINLLKVITKPIYQNKVNQYQEGDEI